MIYSPYTKEKWRDKVAFPNNFSLRRKGPIMLITIHSVGKLLQSTRLSRVIGLVAICCDWGQTILRDLLVVSLIQELEALTWSLNCCTLLYSLDKISPSDECFWHQAGWCLLLFDVSFDQRAIVDFVGIMRRELKDYKCVKMLEGLATIQVWSFDFWTSSPWNMTVEVWKSQTPWCLQMLHQRK